MSEYDQAFDPNILIGHCKTFDRKVLLGDCDLISWFSDFAVYLDTRYFFILLSDYE